MMASKPGIERTFPNYWRDIAWQSSGSTLAQLVGMAGIPILTRLYTPAEFAAQSLFIQVVTYATALVTWRYEYFVQLPRLDEEARSINLLVAALGIVALIALTPLFWIHRAAIAEVLGNQDVAPWLFLAPVTAVLVSWAIAAQHNAQRSGDFRTSGLSELVGKLAYVSSGISGALVHLGTFGLILTTALGAAGKGAYVLFQRPRSTSGLSRNTVNSARRVGKRYGRLATATVLAHLLTTTAIAVPQVAMAHLYGADALGQFALVLATIYLPSALLGAAIGHVYYQRAAKLWAKGSLFFTLWRATASKLLVIGIPVYGLVALVSGYAYPFVFGAQWHLAGEFATWMAVAALASFVSSPMDRTCLVVGAGSYLLLWSLLRAVSSIFVVWLAWTQGFEASSFIMVLSVQMFLLYAIDFYMSHRFSNGQLGVFVAR